MNKIVVSIFAIAMAMGSIQSAVAKSTEISNYKLGQLSSINNENIKNLDKNSNKEDLRTSISVLREQLLICEQFVKAMSGYGTWNPESQRKHIEAVQQNKKDLDYCFEKLEEALKGIQLSNSMDNKNNIDAKNLISNLPPDVLKGLSNKYSQGKGMNDNNIDVKNLINNLPPDVLKELLNKYGQGKGFEEDGRTPRREIKHITVEPSNKARIELLPVEKRQYMSSLNKKTTSLRSPFNSTYDNNSLSIKKLREIRLQNKKLKSLSWLPSELPEADGLYLDNNDIKNLKGLPYMPKLRTLQLVNNPLTKDALINAEWSNVPSLNQIYLPDPFEDKDRQEIEGVIRKSIPDVIIHWGF